MRGGDGVSDVEIRRNEIVELLYTYKKYSMCAFSFQLMCILCQIETVML